MRLQDDEASLGEIPECEAKEKKDDEEFHVRMAQSVPEGSQMVSITLDSGADISALPISQGYANVGELDENGKVKMIDAQGKIIASAGVTRAKAGPLIAKIVAYA